MDVRPWSDSEKRYVLAEAIKSSQIPVDGLFSFVQNQFPVTVWPWEDMPLPQWRSLKQCKELFENPRPGSSVPGFHPRDQSQSQIPSPSPSHLVSSSSTIISGAKRKSSYESSSGPAGKRRQSSADPVTIARDIRPKPPTTGSPLSQVPFPTPEPKKRGRPSKKDVERKQQEAIARGDILPPASSILNYHVPGEDGNVSGYAPILPAVTSAVHYTPYVPISETPIEKDTPESAGSPGKRRRPKAASKSSKAATKQPGESSFNVNPTIDAKIESGEPEVRISIATPETIPVASLMEGPQNITSNFPVTIRAPSTEIPKPIQQTSDA